MNNIKIIGFDADDTLWANEIYYQQVEKEFGTLMSEYLPAKEVSAALYETETQNLKLYGYGAKGFLLSLIETAIKITNGNVMASRILEILDIGKTLFTKDIELIDGVDGVLAKLQEQYPLIIVTKGDLLDQERKLKKSGLVPFFHHIEIMSDKHEEDYLKLISKLGILSHEFLMVGNSLKSDIFPVLAIGGKAVYIPYHTTWQYETSTEDPSAGYETINKISDLLALV